MWLLSQPIFCFGFCQRRQCFSLTTVNATNKCDLHPQFKSNIEPPARKDTTEVGLFAHQPRPVAVRTLCCRKQNPVASLRVLGNRKITFQLNLPVLSPSEVRIANWICCTFGVTPCRGHWQCFRFRSSQKLLTHLLYLAALARFSSAFSEKPANNQRTRIKKIR